MLIHDHHRLCGADCWKRSKMCLAFRPVTSWNAEISLWLKYWDATDCLQRKKELFCIRSLSCTHRILQTAPFLCRFSESSRHCTRWVLCMEMFGRRRSSGVRPSLDGSYRISRPVDGLACEICLPAVRNSRRQKSSSQASAKPVCSRIHQQTCGPSGSSLMNC